jgi:A/G-specific adenine glycosylase
MKTSRPIIPDTPLPRFDRGDPVSIGRFQAMVLSFYADHGRDLAWRRDFDPYCILVSEIMLQQTQVERVAQKYPLFLQAFPDFTSLARAPLPEVLTCWQGLGYNRRAIALRKCAERVVADFGGQLPADIDTLATFPGIGRATASSICAFAFNQPVVFIETNIRRVFIHFFFGDHETVTDAEILPLVLQALYRKDPRTWYNALMDMGTDLKAKVPNPNRRSRHYTRQTAFEGSDRKIRGSILKLLLREKRMKQIAIITRFAEDPERIGRILKNLEDEGFISRSGSFLTIAPR